MALNINIKTEEERYLIELKGDLDIYSSPSFSKEISGKFEKENKDLIFDGKDLDYIDSTGLGAFIGIYKNISQTGKNIKIQNLKNNCKKIFKITDLDKIFGIED